MGNVHVAAKGDLAKQNDFQLPSVQVEAVRAEKVFFSTAK